MVLWVVTRFSLNSQFPPEKLSKFSWETNLKNMDENFWKEEWYKNIKQAKYIKSHKLFSIVWAVSEEHIHLLMLLSLQQV